MRDRGMTASAAARTAAELRREFDAGFAAPVAVRDDAAETLVVVRLDASSRAALRTTELGGIHACPPIQRLPGAPPEQLGVVGLRGAATVVFSLAAVLGRGGAAPGGFLALAGADRSVGFCFAGLEGYFRVGAERIHRRASAGAGAPADELVELDGAACPIVSISQWIASARSRT